MKDENNKPPTTRPKKAEKKQAKSIDMGKMFFDQDELAALCGLSRQTIYRNRHRLGLGDPVMISSNRSVWPRGKVLSMLAKLGEGGVEHGILLPITSPKRQREAKRLEASAVLQCASAIELRTGTRQPVDQLRILVLPTLGTASGKSKSSVIYLPPGWPRRGRKKKNRGLVLPLAHAVGRRAAAVRLAHALLELPLEARQKPPVVDD